VVQAPTTGAVRLMLDPGVPCEGVVEATDEMRLGANLQLILQPTDGGDGRTTRVNAEDLSFRVVGLAGGTYEATLVDRDSGRRYRTSMELPESGSRRLVVEF